MKTAKPTHLVGLSATVKGSIDGARVGSICQPIRMPALVVALSVEWQAALLDGPSRQVNRGFCSSGNLLG
jgi:hypothetical protein